MDTGVIIFCLLGLFLGFAILMYTDIKERIRRKRHPKWYEYYDRALGNSLCIGSRFREKTETINARRELLQKTFFEGKCTAEEYDDAMKILDKELREAAKLFSINKELLGVDADLKEADTYAKEHNLKWGIIFE